MNEPTAARPSELGRKLAKSVLSDSLPPRDGEPAYEAAANALATRFDHVGLAALLAERDALRAVCQEAIEVLTCERFAFCNTTVSRTGNDPPLCRRCRIRLKCEHALALG